jgi:hypothetical protein
MFSLKMDMKFYIQGIPKSLRPFSATVVCSNVISRKSDSMHIASKTQFAFRVSLILCMCVCVPQF